MSFVDLRGDSEQYQAEEMGALPFLADSSALAGSVSLRLPVYQDRQHCGLRSYYHCGHHYQPCGVEFSVCGQRFHDRGRRKNAGGSCPAGIYQSRMGKPVQGSVLLCRTASGSLLRRSSERGEPVRGNGIYPRYFYGCPVFCTL